MKVLVTGGHLTPAIALIDYLQQHEPDMELLFIGREFSRGTEQKAHERREVTRRGVPFIPLHSGKLSFSNPLQLCIQSVRIAIATLKAVGILLKYKPDTCVSFGSYVAVPVAVAAWLLRIPTITHEQTKTAGFANRLIGLLATKVAVSYPESLIHFSKRKTSVTGNLIRERVLTHSAVKPDWIPRQWTTPILYITGGSQGSEILNTTVAQCLKSILKDWFIIHQCGSPTRTRDYAAELHILASQLPKRLQQRYCIREWLTEDELSWVYSHATAAISRAGANSVEELALRGIPAIFVPLPFSLNDEQLHNAQALSQKQQALLLQQKDLNPETLLHELEVLQQQEKKLRRNLRQYSSQAATALPAMVALIRSTS